MYLDKTEKILPAQKVKIQYDCDGGFERCGQEWFLKLKDAEENFKKNNGKHICRKCQLRNNNPMFNDKVKEKVQKTTMKRYGVSCVMNTKENTDKRNETMFGTEEAKQEISEKRRETSFHRYGTDHPMKSAEVKEIHKQAFIDKYGVDCPIKIDGIKEKIAQTNIEKYGNKCSLHGKEIKDKTQHTMLLRYGVRKYNELPEMKDYLKEHCREWLKESWENGGPAKGKERPKEWNEKQSRTVCDLIEKGEWKANQQDSVCGWYHSSKCPNGKCYIRSSYEFKACLMFNEDENIEYYDTEPFKIKYVDIEGNNHYYYPDFIVKFKNREKPLLIEIKPEQQVDWGNNINKFKYAEQYCEENNLIFEVWTEKQLQIDYSWKKSIKENRAKGIC